MTASGPAEPRRRRAPRLRWWREVVYVLVFYAVYSWIRNEGVEAAAESKAQALTNAKRVIRLERLLGSFHEESIQDFFLQWRGFIRFWNIYYGTFHFVVTVAVLVWLFRKAPWRYPLWRNTLACTTALALIGFAFFPLMPPRLLGAGGQYGDSLFYGFVDTLKVIGGLWSFDSGTVQKLSNQYAAMPSLHFGWSSWCALVLLPGLRRPWAKALAVAYPFVTLFAVVVTGNHYWIDALGGVAVLGVAYLLASVITTRVWGKTAEPAGERARPQVTAGASAR